MLRSLVSPRTACWVAVLFAVAGSAQSGGAGAGGGGGGGGGGLLSIGSVSPVTRVVQLLQDLAKQIESDRKKEEGLYETFRCWGENVISTKTASNVAAHSRINELKTYIADIDADRYELTSERVNLEKELEEIYATLEASQDMRKTQHEDFLDAQDDMTKAIAALEGALRVLSEATTGKPAEGNGTGNVTSMLSVKEARAERAGFGERAKEGAALGHAVELGARFLTEGDALFLRRLLTGEVPSWDWKKLNRKAAFKMTYSARSLRIQEVLTKLLATFRSNLAEAVDKDTKANDVYEQLKSAKTAEQLAAQDALQKLEKEKSARRVSKAEAQGEVDSLTSQVASDEQHIAAVAAALEEKKDQWKERHELRLSEIEAINKAIAILHNDDARDLFKRSYASKGYLLLQVGEEDEEEKWRSAGSEGNAAAAAARAAASAAGAALLRAERLARDGRLAALAARAAVPGHFQEVVAAIDNMIATLQAEEAADLQTKEACESERAADAWSAASRSRAIDEHSDTVTRLHTEIKEVQAQLDVANVTLTEAREELREAERMRGDENAAWQRADADDQEAASTVASAKLVLEHFYQENGALVQVRQPEAGAVPLAPPPTWEQAYKVSSEGGEGIIMTLQMIHEDLVIDREKAKVAEDKARAEFESFRTKADDQISGLETRMSGLEGEQGTKQEAVINTKADRRAEKELLDATLEKIRLAEPGCDFAAINFGYRSTNRQIEIDGLRKAKAILGGAGFSTPADPDRPLIPGDASFLLQGPHKLLRR